MIKNKKSNVLVWMGELYPQVITEKVRFPWCTNRLTNRLTSFKNSRISQIAKLLNWDYPKSVTEYLPCDAYMGGEFKCLLIIDEYYKFSTLRLKTLDFYNDIEVNFSIERYKSLCLQHCGEADLYQNKVKRSDFNFVEGAIAKRAMFDVLIDITPLHNNLNPTLRLDIFEIECINSKNELRDLVEFKFQMSKSS
jgi:hypothetical protein